MEAQFQTRDEWIKLAEDTIVDFAARIARCEVLREQYAAQPDVLVHVPQRPSLDQVSPDCHLAIPVTEATIEIARRSGLRERVTLAVGEVPPDSCRSILGLKKKPLTRIWAVRAFANSLPDSWIFVQEDRVARYPHTYCSAIYYVTGVEFHALIDQELQNLTAKKKGAEAALDTWRSVPDGVYDGAGRVAQILESGETVEFVKGSGESYGLFAVSPGKAPTLLKASLPSPPLLPDCEAEEVAICGNRVWIRWNYRTKTGGFEAGDWEMEGFAIRVDTLPQPGSTTLEQPVSC